MSDIRDAVTLLSWAEVRRVIHDYLAPLRWVGNLAAPRPSWPHEPCGYLNGEPDASWLQQPRIRNMTEFPNARPTVPTYMRLPWLKLADGKWHLMEVSYQPDGTDGAWFDGVSLAEGETPQ